MDEMVAKRQADMVVQGAVVHTAALAAFRLWGDCPELRQYLEQAVRINPLYFVYVRSWGGSPPQVRTHSSPFSPFSLNF
jgi:hypothetical protein